MKKTYFKPFLQVVMIENQGVLCASGSKSSSPFSDGLVRHEDTIDNPEDIW